ncbi:hypothetical protein G0Q06_03940 [Puniceicoccales bacterium CK1056]|uniref:Uncharacterized protein n=1 Tax=Oceanipulchritudo coccoides TaxID=2706888 RepID=A0A6B2LYU7_9BACT|nr:hypothetical protein [Oceanipulchritudo coccoides]NDV61593.1 hypothetical protein [Oceanipulchritudo coccoides]
MEDPFTRTISPSRTLLMVLLVVATAGLQAAKDPDYVDPSVFELEAFVVYAGTIDVIDGFTGEPFNEDNPVVTAFREEFNQLLEGYHWTLLRSESEFMKMRIKLDTEFATDLEELAESFGIEGFERDKAKHLKIERAIFQRLMRDPFFRIEALIVWDLDKLKRMDGRHPTSEYAKDIRFNPDRGRWERRVTTRWEVGYRQGETDWRTVVKEQGLNLDTNKGYHFINQPLNLWVTPQAFDEVKLTYPIFFNSEEATDLQVQRLKSTFLTNLTSIYDPFSWLMRRNVRFRGGFQGQLIKAVQRNRIRVSDREWFDRVLANFLNDVITIKYRGVNEIYDLAMLQKVPVNRNVLGQGLDLLNWNPGEERSLNYDPTKQGPVNVNFNQAEGARFILLDAYRRHPDRLIEVFREKLNNLKKRVSGKELVKEVLQEATGYPVELYIEKASEVQEQLLEQFRYKL